MTTVSPYIMDARDLDVFFGLSHRRRASSSATSRSPAARSRCRARCRASSRGFAGLQRSAEDQGDDQRRRIARSPTNRTRRHPFLAPPCFLFAKATAATNPSSTYAPTHAPSPHHTQRRREGSRPHPFPRAAARRAGRCNAGTMTEHTPVPLPTAPPPDRAP